MIRYDDINSLVVDIYSKLPTIRFPLDIQMVIDSIPNCKYMSYQRATQINNCNLDDVIKLLGSAFGCTQYDIVENKYIILCNESTENYNTFERQRWTRAHEIGHIICNHFSLIADKKIARRNSSLLTKDEFELEADYFAASLLAPFPYFKLLNIKSVIDVQNVFGLSTEATLYRYKQYLKWINNGINTVWNRQMVEIFQNKHN